MQQLLEYLKTRPDSMSIFLSLLAFSGVVLAIHIMYRLLDFGVHSEGYEDGMYLKKLKYLPCLVLIVGFINGFFSFIYELENHLKGTSMQIEKIVPQFETVAIIHLTLSFIIFFGVLILSFKFEKSPEIRGKRKFEGSYRKTIGSLLILLLTGAGFSFSLEILEKISMDCIPTFLWISIILILLYKFVKKKPFTEEKFLFKKKSWIREKLEEQKREKVKSQE